METERKCLNCNSPIEGRIDKIFCTANCRSAFHYKRTQSSKKSQFYRIDKILKHNRSLLKHFNKTGKATIRKKTLIDLGFEPRFFTHYWKNKKADVYLFCYEFGFLSIKEKGIDKYLLVHWQPYMEKG